MKSNFCIADAQVQLGLPFPTDFPDLTEKPHPTAAVAIEHWSNCAPPDREDVASFVSHSVPGLDDKSVSVIFYKVDRMARQKPSDILSIIRPTPALIVDYTKRIAIVSMVALSFAALWTSSGTAMKWMKIQYQDVADMIKSLFGRSKK